MIKITVDFRSLVTNHKYVSNVQQSVKCLAFLNAEELISHFYTFGQNSYTCRPLADTNDLKSKSNDLNCEGDIRNFIAAFSDIISS
jgi:hypothetical protein